MICKVCKKWFNPKPENRYEIKTNKKSRIEEAFNCPRCGCQNIVNIKEVEADASKNEFIYALKIKIMERAFEKDNIKVISLEDALSCIDIFADYVDDVKIEKE